MKLFYAFTLATLIAVVSVCSGPNKPDGETLNPDGEAFKPDGEALYKQYCVECHGARLEGNTATPLVKDNWLYGRGAKYLARNIKHGIPNTTMIAWSTVLNDDQIDALVDYVIEAQESPPEQSLPLPDLIETQHYTLKTEILVSVGIDTPWGIEFVDDHRALLTEKPGGLRWLVDGKIDPQPIEGLPKVYPRGGLMDVALDPEYTSNGWIYLAYAHSIDEDSVKEPRALTRIIRGRIDEYRWVDQEILFQVPEERYHSGGNRWGGRMLFDTEGYLIFSIGDMAKGDYSQDPKWSNGKTFRIYPDGRIPDSNPFKHEDGAIGAIYTLGNRNAQGFAIHPVTKEIWATEHGPMGGDELNVLELGKNYGWPVITYGKDYDGSTVSKLTHMDGMEQPIYQWTPSIAVCPIEFSTSPLFPEWENDLILGALAYEEMRRLHLEGRSVVSQEVILKGHGRIRDVKFGPDGYLYVLINQPDQVVRISPVN